MPSSRSLLPFALLALALATLPAAAQTACGDKDYDCKIAKATQSISTNPNDAESYYNRAMAYKNKGDAAHARADLDHYVSLPNDKPEYLADGYAERASMRFQDEDFTGAAADYAESIRLNPANVDRRLARARSLSKAGQYSAAITDFDSYLAGTGLKPEAVGFAYAERGWAKYKLKNVDGAIADYNHAIDADPQDSSAYFRRGMIFSDQAKYELSNTNFDLALKYDPDQTEVYFNRGRNFYLMGSYDKAIDELSTYIAKNAARLEYAADGYRERGVAYAAQTKYDLAISDLTKAIQLNPKAAQSYTERAKAYRKQGKTQLADADDAKATSLK